MVALTKGPLGSGLNSSLVYLVSLVLMGTALSGALALLLVRLLSAVSEGDLR